MHLAVDGIVPRRERLNDVEVVRKFLQDYPAALGMNRIMEPVVLYYNAPTPEDSGVSGFVIIAESHISVHTFPLRDLINVDLFSCKSFDTEKALKEVREYFDLSTCKSWVLERGLAYLPTSKPLAVSGVRYGGRARQPR